MAYLFNIIDHIVDFSLNFTADPCLINVST